MANESDLDEKEFSAMLRIFIYDPKLDKELSREIINSFTARDSVRMGGELMEYPKKRE